MGGGPIPNAPGLSRNFMSDFNDPRLRGQWELSDLRRSLMSDMARAGQAARDQALASQTQALGGSRSSGIAGVLADLGARQAYGQQKALGDLSMREADLRTQLMSLHNAAQAAKNQAALGEYEAARGQRRDRWEDVDRFWNTVGNVGALAGRFL